MPEKPSTNELFVTEDGSHSLLSHRFDVPYHSRHGAVQESRHVFMRMGLDARLEAGELNRVNILEMGFGTGLNALLVYQYAQAHPDLEINYCSFERYPVSPADAAAFNYAEVLDAAPDQLVWLHASPFDERVHAAPDAPNFRLLKAEADLLDGVPDAWAATRFDVVFYDAFAPNSQPELWTQDALRICYNAMAPGGMFVTYCAQGQFKRDLRSVGFTVEALPGPPGKREMTRAVK